MTKVLSNFKPSSVSRKPFQGLLPRMWEDLFDQYLADSNTEFSDMMRVSMDVAETDQAFEIKLDLPGIESDAVDVQVDRNTLTVRGHRTEESEEKDEKKRFHRVERSSGSFSRSIVLPEAINENEAAAEFKDGVLKIVIPKSDEAKPRKINISS